MKMKHTWNGNVDDMKKKWKLTRQKSEECGRLMAKWNGISDCEWRNGRENFLLGFALKVM